jgi:DNA invertase Pin-like site-specific DNA recombinase
VGTEYGSLLAQRDSGVAYITSQQASGWVLVQDSYDDNGWSGATLERPALKRLLADIERGLVDIVVVSKVDRLSRSLLGFAKLIESFDAYEVKLASVTQQINTSTSMGQLALNVLLSFAQFERQIIAERIRDKIASSKRRGKWMGGRAPLGYSALAGKLVLNEPEAKIVCRIFEGFAQYKSGTKLTQVLRTDGVMTKTGRLIDKGCIYRLLNNRTYVGEVEHKRNVYPGEHQAIISRELWQRIHEILSESARGRANRSRVQSSALLRGLIFGVDGRAMSPSHTRRRGKLYRYYVSQTVLKGGGVENVVRRVSAAAIETAVIGQVRALLRQPEIVIGTWMAARSELPDLSEEETRQALERLDPIWDELFPAEQARIIRLLVDRVEIGPAGAEIRLRIAGLRNLVRDLDTERDHAVAAVHG